MIKIIKMYWQNRIINRYLFIKIIKMYRCKMILFNKVGKL